MISPQKRRNDFVFSFCSVALNASFCLKKRKLRKNESEVFRVKIPQRKVTKCNTYKNSLSFTMVSLQFSKKFYYSGCLTSSLSPVKNKGIVQKYTISISNGNIQKKCVNPLDFNFPRIHNLLENPHSHQL